MLGIGYYLKMEKINSKQENQSVLIAKICSRKIQKNRTSAKKNAHKNFVPYAIFYLKGCSYSKPCWKKISNQTFNANIVSALIQSTFCYMRVEIKILSSFFPTCVFCICPPMFDRNYLQLTKESTVSAESSLQFSASKVLVLGRNIPARLFLVFSSSFFPHSVIQLAWEGSTGAGFLSLIDNAWTKLIVDQT